MDNKSLFLAATQLCKRLIRHRLLPVGVLFALSSLLSMGLEDQTAALGPDDETLKLVLTLSMGIWDMVQSLLLILILSWGLPSVRPFTGPKYLPQPFDRPYVATFLAEYLRVLGQVLFWGLLLIIPGFIRYIRLTFVPLIVLFSQQYENGEVDALELSTRLSRGCFKILMLVILGLAGLEAAFEMLPQAFPDLHSLPVRLIFNLMSFLISVWSFSFVVLLFEREMEK